MSKNVQMSALLGGQPISIGNCLPAQARVLVKKGHARWQDGGILLSIRPIHLQVAMNTKRLEKEGNEVSNAELGRRIEWLRVIMGAVVNSDTHGSDTKSRIRAGMPVILGPDGVPLTEERIAALKIDQQQREKTHQEWLLSSVVGADPCLQDLPDEEVEAWYIDVEKELGIEPNPDGFSDLAELWDRELESGRFYTVMRQADSRLAPVRSADPKPLPKIDESDGLTMEVRADVLGEEDGTPSAVFSWTAIDEQDKVSEVLAIRFSQRSKRSPKAQWPHQPCPKCGVGQDTDGDGDCALCGSR